MIVDDLEKIPASNSFNLASPKSIRLLIRPNSDENSSIKLRSTVVI